MQGRQGLTQCFNQISTMGRLQPQLLAPIATAPCHDRRDRAGHLETGRLRRLPQQFGGVLKKAHRRLHLLRLSTDQGQRLGWRQCRLVAFGQ